MSANDSIPEAMRPTRDAVARLHALFQDPEPGLMSWLMMTARAAQDLYKVLDESGAGETAKPKRKPPCKHKNTQSHPSRPGDASMECLDCGKWW